MSWICIFFQDYRQSQMALKRAEEERRAQEEQQRQADDVIRRQQEEVYSLIKLESYWDKLWFFF